MRRHTYCRICEAACGLIADVEGGEVRRLAPDPSHPISRGFACAKGTRFDEVAYDPTRLLEPSLRSAAGDLRAATWTEANRFVVQHVQAIQRRHGAHAVGIYFGNPIAFNAQAAFALPAFNKALGTRNVFSAGSQDCNNKFAGARIVHGSPVVQPFPDFDRADLAVVLGSNPYVSQASFVHLAGGSQAFQRLVDRGGDVLWVDPRKTESAKRWGEHVPIRPGTDAYLLMGWLALLTAESAYPHAEGLDELVGRARSMPLKRISERTGIPVHRIEETAERVRRSPKTAFHMSVGVNQGGFGTLCYVLVQALAFVTHNFDSEGGLLIHPLARLAAKVLDWADLDLVRTSRVGGVASNMGTLPAAIMADEILTAGPERLRALIVIAGDPLVSVPGGERLARAFRDLELLVCIDMFENETGKLAHAILPTTSWLERWDVATTSLQLQSHGLLPAAGPVISPRGNSRNDVRILCDLARGLGAPRALGLGRLNWDRWLPTPRYGLPFVKPKPGQDLARHRPRFWVVELADEIGRLEAVAPAEFVLLSRRRRLGHNSWLHGGARGDAESKAWMHPEDLAALGMRQGGQVTIRSTAGEVTMCARACSDISRATIVIPHGIGATNVNALIPDGPQSIERLSGMATMTGIGVSVAPSDR